MFSLFRTKSQPKVFIEKCEGTILFFVEVLRDEHSLTFLCLQPTPSVYKNFVFERKRERDTWLTSCGYSRDKWHSVPGHIERLGLSIVPSHQEYEKVLARKDSLDKKISGFDRRMWGLPSIDIDPDLYGEREKCEISMQQFWATCDRLYKRMIEELELDNLDIQNNPNKALSSRLDKVHELLDMFEGLEIDDSIPRTQPRSVQELHLS